MHCGGAPRLHAGAQQGVISGNSFRESAGTQQSQTTALNASTINLRQGLDTCYRKVEKNKKIHTIILYIDPGPQNRSFFRFRFIHHLKAE